MSDVIDKLKEALAPLAEQALEKLVESKFDSEYDKAVEAVKEKIPSDQVDLVVAAIAAHFKPLLKAGLLSQIENISDKV